MRPGVAVVGLLVLSVSVSAAESQSKDDADRPVVLEAVAPQYPDVACQERLHGRVEVNLTVLPSGVPTTPVSKGDALFEGSAVLAALQWRFKPAPRRAQVALSFVFTGVSATPTHTHSRTKFRPPYEVEVHCELMEITLHD